MEKITKVIFDPLATSKDQVERLLRDEQPGTAHPFSPEQALLQRTDTGVKKIDISEYPENFFYNAVDLGGMGEVLLQRMAGFSSHLKEFDDFQIMQAPASTFRVPLVKNKISILAVSIREPTYWDFCFADAEGNATCWLAQDTIKGMRHSGDILNGKDLLDYVTMDPDALTDKDICVFISGYQITHISRFLGTHPALMVVDQVQKILYIVPVPLDKATIGDATICCPLVFRRDGDGMILSILSKATTDFDMMCHKNTISSPAFKEAIARANFDLPEPKPTQEPDTQAITEELTSLALTDTHARAALSKTQAIFATCNTWIKNITDLPSSQVIHFGTGLHFAKDASDPFDTDSQSAEVVLPVVFGSTLQGPLILATGTAPSGVPFATEKALHAYYSSLTSAVFLVNDKMTDNARNLAPPYRMNAVFVLQLSIDKAPEEGDALLDLLNGANINAVTALAGPQSLVLVQINKRFYFYRGLANAAHLSTHELKFGDDVTDVVEAAGLYTLLEPKARRIINLDEQKMVLLQSTGKEVAADALISLFHDASVEDLVRLHPDIQAAVPQMQVLMNQVELQKLCGDLAMSLADKAAQATKAQREAYLAFFMEHRLSEDSKIVNEKNVMLGALRARTKEIQGLLKPLVDSLSNIVTLRATSKRSHDLKKMLRHSKIYGNVDKAKEMNFEAVAELLEEKAGDMGVMLMNIKTQPYEEMLRVLTSGSAPALNADTSCELDPRVLHLGGLDAGIVIEQSQQSHYGPLQSQSGSAKPILAVPYLNHGSGSGSMLAWVCWDEFVHLEDPSKVRWVEKCNDSHIAALRIIMRATLSDAVSSRSINLTSASPETGYLMSALLMSAMSKLAATKSAIPSGDTREEDTVTRLMRGLFGNLLTMAGSGVRPQSMVWQLVGTDASFDMPSTPRDWLWYDAVVSMYPYTTWPRQILRNKVERFVDKLILRAVFKGEDFNNGARTKEVRMRDLARYCRLRNIELEHSRSIVTVFQRMLTAPGADQQAISSRLLSCLPSKLERQSSAYTRMIEYLQHLASGSARRESDDAALASVFTRRSAVFAEIKTAAADACRAQDWEAVTAKCKELILTHKTIAEEWSISPKKLLLQNQKPYLALAQTNFQELETDGPAKWHTFELTRQVLCDAEKKRVPWQVGKEGQFNPMIEPLDEGFVHEMVTGEAPKEEDQWVELENAGKEVAEVEQAEDGEGEEAVHELAVINAQLAELEHLANPKFLQTLKRKMTPADVCTMLKVPEQTMRIFVNELNPSFDWETLGRRFKPVVVDLLLNKSRRELRRPAMQMLWPSGGKMLEGAAGSE